MKILLSNLPCSGVTLEDASFSCPVETLNRDSVVCNGLRPEGSSSISNVSGISKTDEKNIEYDEAYLALTHGSLEKAVKNSFKNLNHGWSFVRSASRRVRFNTIYKLFS